MKIHCGELTFDHAMVGRIRNELKHLPLPKGKICIAKDGIANLLSMGKLVKEEYWVTMNLDVENAINVYNNDGTDIKCVCVQDGLYCINLASSGKYTHFLSTIADHKNHFSDVDNKRAALARYIQICLCLPSDVNLADTIDKGGIKECVIDRRHIKIANVIYGPAQASVEGKTVQRNNKMPRDSSLYTNILSSIIEKYGNITLGIDMVHINKRPYIIAISKHIKYIQCIGTENKNITTFLSTIKKFKADYMTRGFVVKVIYADRAFESCKTELNKQGITLYCCDTNVPFIEQAIRFVKERVRCVKLMLPKKIKRIPAWLMRELVASIVKMINSIRRKGRLHPVMSPRLIVTSRKMVLPPHSKWVELYQHFISTVHELYMNCTWTVLELYLNHTWTIPGGFCTVHVQFVYSSCTVHVQFTLGHMLFFEKVSPFFKTLSYTPSITFFHKKYF